MEAIRLAVHTNQCLETRCCGGSSCEHSSTLINCVKRCWHKDEECSAWSKDAPDHFKVELAGHHGDLKDHRASVHESDIFPGRFDIYRSRRVVVAWNMLRCAQVILCSTIIRCMSYVYGSNEYTKTPEYVQTSDRMNRLVEDIISSVPYLLTCGHRRSELFPTEPECAEGDYSRELSGYFLMWTLATIRSQGDVSVDQSNFICGRLYYIGS